MKLNIIRNAVTGAALFLGATMLIDGCQKENITGSGMTDTVTRFEVSVSDISDVCGTPDTKATLHNTTGNTKELSEYLTEFQVAAWEGTSGTTAFITAYTKVKYQESGVENYWSTVDDSDKDVEYIWKKDAATKTFFAYANLPASDASVVCTSAASQTLTLDSLPDNDILLGCYSGNGATGSPAVRTGTASIHFYHPLTAVRFKQGTLSEGVSITGISIVGVYTSGKTIQTSSTETNFSWTKIDGTAFAATDETGTVSLPDVTVDGDGFIGEAIVLIPQTFASDGAHIEVTLDTPTGERTAYYMLCGKNWDAGCTNVITIDYDNSECIRFSAPTAHSISFNFTTPAAGQSFNLQYSTDAATWTDYTSETEPIGFGQSNDVYFRGKNTMGLGNTYKEGTTDIYRGCKFQIDGSVADVTVSGDIMSLIDYENISVDMPAFAFIDLFNGCTALKTANNLQLSAETLSNNCYYQMFYGCTGLENAPELFSEHLANYCYSNMFYGCTKLEKAPVIHATEVKTSCFSGMFQGCTSLIDVQSNLYAETLATSCYDSMFFGCTSLKKAPVIHATTLASGCCRAMFRNCTSLVTVQSVLEAAIMKSTCYNYMFAGCTSLKTAPDIMAQTLAQSCFQNMFSSCTILENVQSDLFPETMASSCYSSMFNGCTSLKKAPVIHATTLANNCFYSMFYGCSNLQYVKCLAVSEFNDNCLGQFLTSVSSSGTFIYNHELGDAEAVRQRYVYVNASGETVRAIPEGWTVIPDNEE